ncbi:MAG: DUF1127 domain-containing protein [Cypionkella sp.]
MTKLLTVDGRNTPRGGLRSLLAATLTRFSRNREMAHLARLDDRLLRDVGLTSTDLEPWR